MKAIKILGMVSGGFCLVMAGVNVAPTVRRWQGLGYDWTFGRSQAKAVSDQDTTRRAIRDELQQFRGDKDVEVVALRTELKELRNLVRSMPPPAAVIAPERDIPIPPKELIDRLDRLEQDHQSLVRLQMSARQEVLALEEKMQPQVPVAVVPAVVGPNLDELAVRADIEEPRSTIRSPRRPTTINNKQRAWVRGLDNYRELHRSMSDLQIMNRFGWAGVWEMSDKPTQCAPGDPNCPVHGGPAK